MASIRKPKTSKFFQAGFRDNEGKQHWVSTHETRKGIARKIAAKYEIAAKRKTSKKALWETLLELQTLITGDKARSTTIQDFCKQWLENRQAEKVATATFSIYEKVVNRFLAFLGTKRAQSNLIDVSQRDLEKFRNELCNSGLA